MVPTKSSFALLSLIGSWCHSKLSTTERYLAKFDQRKADEAMTRLYGEE